MGVLVWCLGIAIICFILVWLLNSKKNMKRNLDYYDGIMYSWKCPFCGFPSYGFKGYLEESECYNKTHYCSNCKYGYKIRLENGVIKRTVQGREIDKELEVKLREWYVFKNKDVSTLQPKKI